MGKFAGFQAPKIGMDPALKRYAIAAAAVASAIALEFALYWAGYPQQASFLLAPAAIMVAAWFAGMWAGIVCTMITAVAVVALIPTLRTETGELTSAAQWNVGLFIAAGTAISVLTGIARHTCPPNSASSQRAHDAPASLPQPNSGFLVDVSHELRTPMTAMLGMIELALDEQLSPQARKYLLTAKTSADALRDLVNDLLDYSRLELGRLALESEPFDVRQAFDRAIQSVSPRARAKGLKLRHSVDVDVPNWLTGDAARFREVLVKLTGNAIKFTDKGEISVSAAAYSNGAQHTALEFIVADTGIGIAPADQERIFAPFTQVDGSTTRLHAGSGLGLNLAQQLVERMGGTIRVESQLGRGSRFVCLIPFQNASQPVAPVHIPRPQHLHVLVADDTQASQMVVAAILNKRGHRVELASNGREAAELAARDDFDLILMDVQMPKMDGYAATAAIRSGHNPRRASVPIVAMTAHARLVDRETCLSAGMDAFVSKPVDAKDLVELVESHARPKFEDPSPTEERSRVVWRVSEPTNAFDRKRALTQLGGDEALLEQLTQLFEQDAPEFLAEIDQAILDHDPKRIELAAHSLRGLAANFCASPTVNAAAALERMGRMSSVEQCKAGQSRLKTEIAKLLEALKPPPPETP